MEENFSKILVEELKKLEIHAWILTPACNLAVISKESWPEQYAKKKKKMKSAEKTGKQAQGHSSWFNWLKQQIKIYSLHLPN